MRHGPRIAFLEDQVHTLESALEEHKKEFERALKEQAKHFEKAIKDAIAHRKLESDKSIGDLKGSVNEASKDIRALGTRADAAEHQTKDTLEDLREAVVKTKPVVCHVQAPATAATSVARPAPGL